MLDTLTLNAMFALTHLLVTVALIMAWLINPGMAGVKLWALGRLVTTLALVLVALRSQIPLLISTTGGNLLLFFGVYLVWQGCLEFMGRRSRYRLAIILLILLASYANGYFSVVEPNENLRWAGTSFTLLIIGLATSAALWPRRGAGDLRSSRVMAVIYLLHGLFFAIPLTLALNAATGAEHGHAALFKQLVFIEAIAISIIAGVGLIVMITERLQIELIRAAERDSLTDIYNRRAFYPIVENLLARRRRSGLPISCLVIDIDNFKRLNDRHGHLIGDQLLKHTVAVIQLVLREQDVLARFGGEEFVICLPDTDADGAERVAERIRTTLESSLYRPGPQSEGIQVTASIGSTTLHSEQEDLSFEALFSQADLALYQAKESGRNRSQRYAGEELGYTSSS